MEWFRVQRFVGTMSRVRLSSPGAPNVIGSIREFQLTRQRATRPAAIPFCARPGSDETSVQRKWPFNERPLPLTCCLEKLALHEATDDAEASQCAAQQHRSRSAVRDIVVVLALEEIQ